MRALVRVFGALSAGALAACSTPTTPAASDAASDLPAVIDVAADVAVESAVDAGPRPLSELRCSAPEPWAEPLSDYLAAGETATDGGTFLRAVQDLAVYEDRLYLGYGDANLNLGRLTAIEVRAFTDDSRPEAASEFRTDEEQIEQFRALDHDLWIAGIDATEDNWLGNVYRRPRAGAAEGSAWRKLRTVHEGVHVHDAAWWRGALWTVGSGSVREDWMRGDIYGHLWRSDDRGMTFATAARHHNMGRGDARWVRILALPDALLLFGYRTDAANRATIVNMRWDGSTAAALDAADPLRAAFVRDTHPTADGGGLVRAAVNGTHGLIHRAFRVTPDGAAGVIERFNGRRVLDAFLSATGEMVVMSADSDDWRADPLEWSVRVEATRDLVTFTEVLAFQPQEALRAVAVWRGRMYFGTDRGAVLRCDLAPE